MTIKEIRDRANNLAGQMMEVNNKLWDSDKEETDRLLQEYEDLESEYMKYLFLAIGFIE